MPVISLRRILTLQPVFALLLPFTIAALIGFMWLKPQIRIAAETRQLQVARAVGSEVESHLEASVAIVSAAAAIPNDSDMSQHNYQHLLNALLTSSESLSSLYVVKMDGRISTASLKKDQQIHRQDLTSLDLSRNFLFRDVAQSRKPRWSEVFLSVINGGLSAAYAAPRDGAVVIGEVDLGHLTEFLKQIGAGNDQLIMIVDHKGQVIADNDGRHTAQQLNIGNITMVRKGIVSNSPTTGSLDFSGESMTGSMAPIPSVNWYVLVAQKNALLYRTEINIAWIVLSCILIALACALAASIYLARRMATRFDALARHAQNFAHGSRSNAWPVTSIAEFNQLSRNLQSMADTLQQQELVLRESESRITSLYNISQYPFIDETGFLDHALEEIIKLTGSEFGYIYFYSEQKRQFTLNSWSNGVMEGCEVQQHKTVYDLDSTGFWGEAVRQKKAMMLNDFAAQHPLKKGVPEGHVQLKRFLTVPVMVDDSIVAVVGVANKDSDYLDSDVMQLTLFMDAVWKIINRKRDEEARLKMEQQLLHTQKLESLGILAGGIAHDFNNILTAIIGNADLALMRINRESPAVDNLHRIEQAAARAADLAKQMLAYSGKGKFLVESLDLNRLLEEMLHMLEVSISKNAVLRLNLTKPLPTVDADATQIRQIIMNLVINASEAIGDRSGVISATTGCMECDERYLKDVWLDENLAQGLYVYLEISDSGCGMDKETMAKLFDPFFTTKFTGRGLGMSAVMGIVRGHRGAIKVYSEPGRGSSFKILLPASGRSVDLKDDIAKNDWRGSGRVLLVDDEETVRVIGAELLKELGFTVVTADDGRQALDMFRNSPDFAFVILDLTMPHMDGEQCFRELRHLKPDVKVIISSGYNEYEVSRKFIGKGLAGFIQKPYRLGELKEAVKKLG